MKYFLCIMTTALMAAYSNIACAETVVLKSGKKIQGKILEKTKDYIKVDYKPSPVYYTWDSIDTIDGQPVPGRQQKAALQQSDQPAGTAMPSAADTLNLQALLDAREREIESLRNQLSDSRQLKEDFDRLKQAYVKLQAKYFNNLGGTLLYEKEFDKAARAFQEALDIDPWNPEACFNLGMLNDEYLKDAKAAVSFYERYLLLSPNAPDRREIEDRIAQLK